MEYLLTNIPKFFIYIKQKLVFFLIHQTQQLCFKIRKKQRELYRLHSDKKNSHSVSSVHTIFRLTFQV